MKLFSFKSSNLVSSSCARIKFASAFIKFALISLSSSLAKISPFFTKSPRSELTIATFPGISNANSDILVGRIRPGINFISSYWLCICKSSTSIDSAK